MTFKRKHSAVGSVALSAEQLEHTRKRRPDAELSFIVSATRKAAKKHIIHI